MKLDGRALAEHFNVPWLTYDVVEVPVLILDHHMMQTYRQCEARFELEFIHGWGGAGRVWFLEFGIVFHKIVEYYYNNFRDATGQRVDLATLLEYSRSTWYEHDLDSFSDHPEYTRLGGFQGLQVLIAQYYGRFNAENERLRVIGAELYFGRGREVPIISNPTDQYPFRMYLSGKIDLLVDDGSNIGPMDHKTSKDFRGQDPNRNYEVQEGMTGYVYAARAMLNTIAPDIKRTCNKIWMNYAQVKPESDVTKRFSRVPIYKTDWQLEQFRLRQARTGQQILTLLQNLAQGGASSRNTAICSNWMHQECAFKQVHRQNTAESELTILNSSFTRKPIWNPEEVRD